MVDPNHYFMNIVTSLYNAVVYKKTEKYLLHTNTFSRSFFGFTVQNTLRLEFHDKSNRRR